jgi:hypothetical protein
VVGSSPAKNPPIPQSSRGHRDIEVIGGVIAIKGCDGKLGHRMTPGDGNIATAYPCFRASGLAQQIGGTISPMEPSVAGAAG